MKGLHVMAFIHNILKTFSHIPNCFSVMIMSVFVDIKEVLHYFFVYINGKENTSDKSKLFVHPHLSNVTFITIFLSAQNLCTTHASVKRYLLTYALKKLYV